MAAPGKPNLLAVQRGPCCCAPLFCIARNTALLTSHSVPDHQWGAALRASQPHLHGAKAGSLDLRVRCRECAAPASGLPAGPAFEAQPTAAAC